MPRRVRSSSRRRVRRRGGASPPPRRRARSPAGSVSRSRGRPRRTGRVRRARSKGSEKSDVAGEKRTKKVKKTAGSGRKKRADRAEPAAAPADGEAKPRTKKKRRVKKKTQETQEEEPPAPKVKQSKKTATKPDAGAKTETKTKKQKTAKAKPEKAKPKKVEAEAEKQPSASESSSSDSSDSYYSSSSDEDEQRQQLLKAMMPWAVMQSAGGAMTQGAMAQQVTQQITPASKQPAENPGMQQSQLQQNQYASYYGIQYDAYGRPYQAASHMPPSGYPGAGATPQAGNMPQGAAGSYGAIPPGLSEADQEWWKIEMEERDRAMRRAQDEQRIKNEEFQRLAAVERAVQAIRIAISNLQMGPSEHLDTLMKTLDTVVSAEIEHADSHTINLKTEIDKVVADSTSRMDVMKELKTQCKDGEELLRSTAELLRQNLSGKEGQDWEDHMERLEGCGLEAIGMSEKAKDFLEEKATELQRLHSATKGPGLIELKLTAAKLLKLSCDLKQQSVQAANAVREGKVKLDRRAACVAYTEHTKTIFKKYDADADGFLSRREVIAYSEGQFKFKPSDDCLDRIWRNWVTKDKKGVSLECFQRLKVAIGSARVVARESAASRVAA